VARDQKKAPRRNGRFQLNCSSPFLLHFPRLRKPYLQQEGEVLPHFNDEAPLWSLVRHIVAQEAESWRKEHHPNLSLEVAMTQHVTELHTEVKHRPGGLIWVTVSVLARAAFECETNAYRLQRAGNRFYKIVEPGSFEPSE
jgi:hypothetical protein